MEPATIFQPPTPLARLGRFFQQQALLLMLLGFTLTVRLVGFQGYELNGDNTQAWEFVRALVEGDGLRFNHHTTRWGLLFPSLVSFLLFGTAPIASFIPPLAASLLQAAGLYRCGALLHSPASGVLAAVLLVMFPEWQFSGTQLMPSGFSAAYLVWTVYFLLRYWKDDSGHPRFALACGLALFVAYLGKEPNLLAMPGLVVGLWLCHRNVKHVALFCGLLLGLFLLETGLYAALIDKLPLGRYSALAANHLKSSRLVPLRRFWDLFERYDVLTSNWHFLFYAYATTCAALLACYKFVNRGVWLVALVSATYYLGLGLAVKSIDPITPAQPFRDRYFADAAPLMFLVLVSAVFESARWTQGPRPTGVNLTDAATLPAPAEPPEAWRLRRWLNVNPFVPFSGVLFAMLSLYTWQFRANSKDPHPLTQLGQLQRAVKLAYERGDPIVSYDGKAKSLYATRHVFWPYPIGDKPRAGFYKGRLGRPVSFLTKGKLKGRAAQQRYLNGYRNKKVLIVGSRRGKLTFRRSVLWRSGAKKRK